MPASRSAVGTGRRLFIAVGAILALALAQPAGQQPPPGGQPAGRGRQGGPNANPFPGQTAVNAMIVTGGCCHDYTGQSKVLMDTLNAVMPINWTVV